MSELTDDYFKDLDATITDHDRIKAGYMPLPAGRDALLIKPISVSQLSGDMKSQPVPIPLNFHINGMFDDPIERLSYEKTFSTETSSTLVTQNTERSVTIPPDSQQLIVRENNNPYATQVMVQGEYKCQIKTIGENRLIVARGPDNNFGRPGFYGGVFTSGRFGSYPLSDAPIRYNPHNVNDTLTHQQTDEFDDMLLHINKQLEPVKPEKPVKTEEHVMSNKPIETNETIKQVEPVESRDDDIEMVLKITSLEVDMSMLSTVVDQQKNRIEQLEQKLARMLEHIEAPSPLSKWFSWMWSQLHADWLDEI